MNASKEAARDAIAHVQKLIPEVRTIESLKAIQDFLLAAERKLPSEAAYEREKKRKRERKS